VGRADRGMVKELYRTFAQHVVELEYEKQPWCIKSQEQEVYRQGACKGSVGLLATLFVVFNLVITSAVAFIWNEGDLIPNPFIGNPFWAFLYFSIVNGVTLAFVLLDRLSLCLCSPTYRFRWRSCLWRLLCCEGLGNGPDPADQMRFVVYGERGGPPRSHHGRATVAPATESLDACAESVEA